MSVEGERKLVQALGGQAALNQALRGRCGRHSIEPVGLYQGGRLLLPVNCKKSRLGEGCGSR